MDILEMNQDVEMEILLKRAGVKLSSPFILYVVTVTRFIFISLTLLFLVSLQFRLVLQIHQWGKDGLIPS